VAADLKDIKGGTVLFSEMTPPDGGEESFNRWYDGHHTPSHVEGVSGFLSAMRYQSQAGPHYLAVYELQSPETLDSPEYRSRKLTPDDATREMLESVSGFTRYIANEAFSAVNDAAETLPLDAAVLLCMFFTVPLEARGDFNAWFDTEHVPMLFEEPGWLMARRFDVIGQDPEPYTHLLLHYLADDAVLTSPVRDQALQTEWRTRLAAQPWYAPLLVTYHRRNKRFLKSG
jgi:hypothetical protein